MPPDLRTALASLRLTLTGWPGACLFAITNVCNAHCDFCGYARERVPAAKRVWADLDRAKRALDALFRRGVRSVTFTGGEPTLHRGLPDMVSHASALGMTTHLISTGFVLSRALTEQLRDAGLGCLLLSVDAADAVQHEASRGLQAGFARIVAANQRARELGLATAAMVIINRLITDYSALAAFLTEAGFGAVRFCYPKRTAYSSSRACSDSSRQIDFSAAELSQNFLAVQAIRQQITVLNPEAAVADMIRHLRDEPERRPCLGGCKSFYLDYNFDLYRCDYWPTPMGRVESFATLPLVRDDCARCMSDYFRDAAADQTLAMALADSLHHLSRLRPDRALRVLTTGAVRDSARRWWRNAVKTPTAPRPLD